MEQVYGNNVEIQAMSEMYNRPIHIYSYSIGIAFLGCVLITLIFWCLSLLRPTCLLIEVTHAEPINIFHGSYNTDVPPIRLSYHHGNHYNSLVDPRRLSVGAGLGFSCLRGVCLCSYYFFVHNTIIHHFSSDKRRLFYLLNKLLKRGLRGGKYNYFEFRTTFEWWYDCALLTDKCWQG